MVGGAAAGPARSADTRGICRRCRRLPAPPINRGLRGLCRGHQSSLLPTGGSPHVCHLPLVPCIPARSPRPPFSPFTGVRPPPGGLVRDEGLVGGTWGAPSFQGSFPALCTPLPGTRWGTQPGGTPSLPLPVLTPQKRGCRPPPPRTAPETQGVPKWGHTVTPLGLRSVTAQSHSQGKIVSPPLGDTRGTWICPPIYLGVIRGDKIWGAPAQGRMSVAGDPPEARNGETPEGKGALGTLWGVGDPLRCGAPKGVGLCGRFGAPGVLGIPRGSGSSPRYPRVGGGPLGPSGDRGHPGCWGHPWSSGHPKGWGCALIGCSQQDSLCSDWQRPAAALRSLALTRN